MSSYCLKCKKKTEPINPLRAVLAKLLLKTKKVYQKLKNQEI